MDIVPREKGVIERLQHLLVWITLHSALQCFL